MSLASMIAKTAVLKRLILSMTSESPPVCSVVYIYKKLPIGAGYRRLRKDSGQAPRGSIQFQRAVFACCSGRSMRTDRYSRPITSSRMMTITTSPKPPLGP